MKKSVSQYVSYCIWNEIQINTNFKTQTDNLKSAETTIRSADWVISHHLGYQAALMNKWEKSLQKIANEMTNSNQKVSWSLNEFFYFFVLFPTTILRKINPLTTNVPDHIQTSQLICRANQLTGFYMIRNIDG